MSQISVLIADDHEVFREGLCMLFANHPDIKVVGEVADGLQALSLAKEVKPDILLLDIRMPGLDGLEVLRRVRAVSPKTKVLILSGFFEEDLITEALVNGAKGFLEKTLPYKDLVKAIIATYKGEIWAKRQVLAEVLDKVLRKLSGIKPPLPSLGEPLTERENEVVECVIQGMTNKEVAEQLGISQQTVKTHLCNIFVKLNINRRLQLLLR